MASNAPKNAGRKAASKNETAQAPKASAGGNRVYLVIGLLLAVLAVMVSTGVFAGGPSGKAVAAEIDGDVQRISMQALPQFSPQRVSLKAGIPTEVTVGQGSGCSAAMIIPKLGVSQDLANGAVIKLPALEPGTYEYTCQMGHAGGAFEVE